MQTSDFQTLRAPVETRGIGLHSGAMIRARLLPRDEIGIVVTRLDLPDAPRVPATLSCVSGTTHATTLQAGEACVATTEHLLAALWTSGITHCQIELDGPEVPILDGSAAGWCRLLQAVGTRVPDQSQANQSASNESAPAGKAPGADARDADSVCARLPVWGLREPVWVAQGDAFVLGLPHPELRVSVAVEYSPVYVGRQSFDAVITRELFEREIAPARTFTLPEWLEPLRAQGLIRGGSVDNAVVLSADGPSSPFRFVDEVARHKTLDVLGDIALLFGADGGRLHAHLIATRAGHGAHRLWMEECLRRDVLVRVDE